MSTPSTVVDALARTDAPEFLVVDLTDATFTDSTGLFVISGAARRSARPVAPATRFVADSASSCLGSISDWVHNSLSAFPQTPE
jgi:hypothetical protein